MLLAEVTHGFVLASWETDAIVRLLVSAALGAAIGLEREQHGRSAKRPSPPRIMSNICTAASTPAPAVKPTATCFCVDAAAA